MIWDLVQSTWRQVANTAREQWIKLIADDFDIEGGRREHLAGNSRKRHGVNRHDADNEMSEKDRQAIELWFSKD